MKQKTTDGLIIGYDFTRGKDKSILIVGRKSAGDAADIINVFQGEEAEELYKKLTTVKEKTNG